MTQAETEALMQHHGIATSQHAVYHFREFRYGNLQDALNYAGLVASRESAARAAETRKGR